MLCSWAGNCSHIPYLSLRCPHVCSFRLVLSGNSIGHDLFRRSSQVMFSINQLVIDAMLQLSTWKSVVSLQLWWVNLGLNQLAISLFWSTYPLRPQEVQKHLATVGLSLWVAAPTTQRDSSMGATAAPRAQDTVASPLRLTWAIQVHCWETIEGLLYFFKCYLFILGIRCVLCFVLGLSTINHNWQVRIEVVVAHARPQNRHIQEDVPDLMLRLQCQISIISERWCFWKSRWEDDGVWLFTIHGPDEFRSVI